MKRSVDTLTDEIFDLLILGGGITGAGVALDAATRGIRVALIDKGDFASGTSSLSSKLVHGGLRYLEYGGFHLVHEALRERGHLLTNAPHLVKPLRFILPFYRGQRRRPWQWRLGLTLYDILAGRHNLQRSRPLSEKLLAHEFPILRKNHLIGGAEYFDCQMDDARLCIEVLASAMGQGACAANYVAATGFEIQGGKISAVRAQDQIHGKELTIRARQILNATGPWVDAVCQLAGEKGSQHLQPTKGVHIIVPGQNLAAAFLLLHPKDGRVLFVIPWMGKTLIGTTDTFTKAGPDELEVCPEEISYLLDAYNHHFDPTFKLEDVLGSFAGLRPLIRARPGQPSSLSREFRLFESASGLITAAGGKYTTYRHMAEEITNVIMRRLGRKRFCRTRNFPLEGTPSEPWNEYAAKTEKNLMADFGLTDKAAEHLVNRYGKHATDVAALLQRHPDGSQPIAPGEPDLKIEILYQREHEMAIFPADHLLRRTRLGLFRSDARLP